MIQKTLTVLILSFFYSPSLMAAGGGGSHGPDYNFFVSVFNFSVLLILLYVFLKKPLKEFFAGRSAELKKAIQESQAAHAEVLKENEELKAKLSRIEAEAAALLADFKREGESEKNKIIKNAQAYAEKLKADASQIADAEVKRAQEELKKITVGLAKELAEKSLKAAMNDQEEEKLSQSYIGQIRSL